MISTESYPPDTHTHSQRPIALTRPLNWSVIILSRPTAPSRLTTKAQL